MVRELYVNVRRGLIQTNNTKKKEEQDEKEEEKEMGLQKKL
jgi:hypothetical protein